MTFSKKLCTLLMGAGSLAACHHTPYPIDPDFGAAVRAANDKQIVSKDAVPGAPVADPRMSAAAYQRYLDGKVKKPKTSEEVTASQ